MLLCSREVHVRCENNGSNKSESHTLIKTPNAKHIDELFKFLSMPVPDSKRPSVFVVYKFLFNHPRQGLQIIGRAQNVQEWNIHLEYAPEP